MFKCSCCKQYVQVPVFSSQLHVVMLHAQVSSIITDVSTASQK